MTDNTQPRNPTAPTSQDYYTALHQAALTFSSSLELDQVLQSIVMSITQAMNVKACLLRLLDRETGQLRLSAVYGLSSKYLAKGPVHIGESPVDKEALKGSPVYIADVRSDPRFLYPEAAREEGLVSVLCVPLEVHGEAIGVLRVYTTAPVNFREDDIHFLTVLASLAALSIENARLYEGMRTSYHGMMNAFWGSQVIY